VVVYGGVSRDRQALQLEYANIVVATPGRLLDFLKTGCLDISNISYLIIDEADLMLDMGFEPDMQLIKGFLSNPEMRLTAMFSATWPTEVQELADMFLNNPVLISVGKATGSPLANKAITQQFQIFQSPQAKLGRLLEILKELGPAKKVLVFTLTKLETYFLSRDLRKSGISAQCISSDLSQLQRERVLSDFKSGRNNVLVATDVASRGLDIPNVEAVINYSFPQTIEAYVHRIGRTGRAGKKGISYTFLSPFEFVPTKQLITVIQKSDQVVPPELYSFRSRGQGKNNSRFTRFNNNNNNRNNFNNRNQFYNNDYEPRSYYNKGNKFNSNMNKSKGNNRGEETDLDPDVLQNLKKDPKKLAAIVNFINSLN